MNSASQRDLPPLADSGIQRAYLFGELLRENESAARYYDACTPEERQALLLKLDQVEDLPSFVASLGKHSFS